MPTYSPDVYIFSSHGSIIPDKERMVEIKDDNLYLTFTKYDTMLLNQAAYLVFLKAIRNEKLKKFILDNASLKSFIVLEKTIEEYFVLYGFLELIKEYRIKFINLIQDNKTRKNELKYITNANEFYNKIEFLNYDDVYVYYDIFQVRFLEIFFDKIETYLQKLHLTTFENNWRGIIPYKHWWNDEMITVLNSEEILTQIIIDVLNHKMSFDPRKTYYDIFKIYNDYEIKFYKKNMRIPYYEYHTDLLFYEKENLRETLGRFNAKAFQAGLKKIEDYSRIKEPVYFKLDEPLDYFTIAEKPRDNCDIELYKKVRTYMYEKAIFPSQERINDIKCIKDCDTRIINGKQKDVELKRIDVLNTNISELMTFLNDNGIKTNLIILATCSTVFKSQDEIFKQKNIPIFGPRPLSEIENIIIGERYNSKYLKYKKKYLALKKKLNL